jgi:hypothetical protein
MEDDCYLPWHTRAIPEISRRAELSASNGDPEPLRNGVDRPVDDTDNGWYGATGTTVEMTFETSVPLREARLVFDSDLNRVDTSRGHTARNMRHYYALDADLWHVPETLVKAFRIDTQTADGSWETAAEVSNNYQRLVRVPLEVETRAVRFVPLETWGAERAHVFSFDVR